MCDLWFYIARKHMIIIVGEGYLSNLYTSCGYTLNKLKNSRTIHVLNYYQDIFQDTAI